MRRALVALALALAAARAAAAGGERRVEPLPASSRVLDADQLREAARFTVRGGLAAAATCVNHADPAEGGPTGGTLRLSGVPPGARILLAWLYWSVLSGDAPVAAAPAMDGTALAPVLVGELPVTPCFDGDKTRTTIWRADVAALVTGDGTHVLSGFVGTGTRDGDFTEGATLLVVFCDRDSPPRDVIVWEGVDVTRYDTREWFTQSLSGFLASGSPPRATLVVVAGNGQSRDPTDDPDPLLFQGIDLDAADPSILSGALCPPDGLYDLTKLDVTGLVPDGATGATLAIRAVGDCHSVGAVALAVDTPPDDAVREPSALDLRPSAEPLRVRRQGASIVATWEDTGTRYDAWIGTIGTWYSHAPLACDLAAASVDFTPAPMGSYLLAVATGCGGAASSGGRDSFLRERPDTLAASGTRCP